MSSGCRGFINYFSVQSFKCGDLLKFQSINHPASQQKLLHPHLKIKAIDSSSFVCVYFPLFGSYPTALIPINLD